MIILQSGVIVPSWHVELAISFGSYPTGWMEKCRNGVPVGTFIAE